MNHVSASRVASLGLAGYRVTLLDGKDEEAYWVKVKVCREARRKGGGKKANRPKNGMTRLVEKASAGKQAATATRCHIKFDD
jgi:hypothetical protein